MTQTQSLTPEQIEQLADARDTVVEILGKFLAYKFYRRLGAPPWAAWLGVQITVRLTDLLDSVEFIEAMQEDIRDQRPLRDPED